MINPKDSEANRLEEFSATVPNSAHTVIA